MQAGAAPGSDVRARIRPRRVLSGVALGLAVLVAVFGVTQALRPRRTTPVYDPPVLAGQQVPGYCSAGFYARHGTTIVVTSSPHCADGGTVALAPDGVGVLGVFSAAARDATCPYPGHSCAASDMDYLVVAPDRIPWGHLNLVDMGTGGYRVIAPGTIPLGCADIAVGDPVEIDGRGIDRIGTVEEKGQNLHSTAEDGSFFPCMIAARVQVGNGDSGGGVLVRGIPAGVTSRDFGGWLGFTPLAEGLAEMGLELCTAPDCGLTPPVAGSPPAPGAPSS
jgi:hypothetical protein